MKEALSKFVRTYSMVEVMEDKITQKTIQRPSLFERHVKVYMSVFKMVENFGKRNTAMKVYT